VGLTPGSVIDGARRGKLYARLKINGATRCNRVRIPRASGCRRCVAAHLSSFSGQTPSTPLPEYADQLYADMQLRPPKRLRRHAT
jgi:hypothetical protein